MSAISMLLTPGAAQGSFPGANGVIAYTGEISKFQPYRSDFLRESIGTAIWALEPETGDQRQLTSGPADAAPSFSPSGNMLAFQRHGAKGWTIFLARADGSEAKPLVSGTQPAFSPDGQEIIFVRPTGLFVTGIAPGSPVRRVTHHRGDTDPEWSTSGAIAFERTYEKYFPHLRVISSLLDMIALHDRVFVHC